MGLVILSVFALAFAACGDSNTGDPGAPPVNPGNGNQTPGNGGQTVDPPDVVDPPAPVLPTANRLVVISHPNVYSFEGQRPILTGTVIEIYFTDGSMKREAAVANFTSIPAVLGQGQVQSLTDKDKAVNTPIQVYHNTYPEAGLATVVLPGVRQIMFTNEASAAVAVARANGAALAASGAGGARNWAVVTSGAAVFGNGLNLGVNVVTSDLGAMTIFQDGAEPALNTITVQIKYEPFATAANRYGTSSSVSITDPAFNGIDAPTVGGNMNPNVWRNVTLTKDYIWGDYRTDYSDPTAPAITAASDLTGLRFDYGIDPEQRAMYFLISRGLDQSQHIYVRVPFASTTIYNYVRAIEIESIDWTKATALSRPSPDGVGTPTAYPFIIEGKALDLRPKTAASLGGSDTAANTWELALLAADITLRVHYWNSSESLVRGPDFFNRAYYMGRAGVYNHPLLDVTTSGGTTQNGVGPTATITRASNPDDREDYGILVIGYYTSLPNGVTLNPIGVGDFTNLVAYTLPIATYREDTLALRHKALAFPKDRDLDLVSHAAGFHTQHLNRFRNTYDIVGTFRYTPPRTGGVAQQTDVVDIIFGGNAATGVMESTMFSGFPSGDTSEIETVDMTFTLDADLVSGTRDGTNATWVKASRFDDQSYEFTVTRYPIGFDVF